MRVISSDDGLPPASSGSLQSALARIVSDSSGNGYFFDKVDKQDFLIMYNRSRYNKWIFISFAPASMVFRKSNDIKNLTLTIVAGMLTFVLLLAIKGSQGLYSPVRKLYKLAQRSVDTGKKAQPRDEFKVINDTVENLITTNEKYRDEITKQAEMARSFFIRRLLQGEIEKSQIRRSLDSYSLPYLFKCITLMAIKIDDFENTPFRDDKDHKISDRRQPLCYWQL